MINPMFSIHLMRCVRNFEAVYTLIVDLGIGSIKGER